jgi:ATP-dependent DNA ligase
MDEIEGHWAKVTELARLRGVSTAAISRRVTRYEALGLLKTRPGNARSKLVNVADGLWRKAKCLNRQEFVVVGWTDPEGSRPHLGALLLGYYTDEGKLIYAGRVGTGMPEKVLKDLRRRLDPLARPKSPFSAQPPRTTRFGTPLELSRVHWVDPKLVAEITYLTWTADGLLRQTVYVGLREDKPADQVRRER